MIEPGDKAAIVTSQANLDQCWEGLRQQVEQMPRERFVEFVEMIRSPSPRLIWYEWEWDFASVLMRTALKQIATNSVRRAMEDTRP